MKLVLVKQWNIPQGRSIHRHVTAADRNALPWFGSPEIKLVHDEWRIQHCSSLGRLIWFKGSIAA